MTKILVVADVKEGHVKSPTLELISKAKSLQAEVASVLIGKGVKHLTTQLVDAGSDIQYVVEADHLEKYSASLHALAVTEASKDFSATQVWFAGTESGKSSAPRVAAKLKATCMSDVIDIQMEGNIPIITRPSYASKIIEVLKPTVDISVLIIRPGSFSIQEGIQGSENIKLLEPPKEDLKVVIQNIVQETNDAIDIADAEIVVCVGRGAKNEEGIAFVKEFADELKAGFGASRAVVDSGWMPHNTQIGQTGKVIAPSLYFGVGVSGAIQHVAGMGGSKVIVAINNDADAPIFNIADYGIVGDLFEVLPILKEEIKKVRS